MPKLKIADAEINYVIVGEQGEWLARVGGLISAFGQNWEKYFPKSSPPLSKPHGSKKHRCVMFPFSGYRDRWIFKAEERGTFEVTSL